jgi:hypothetical protein
MATSASRTCDRATADVGARRLELRHGGVVLLLRHFVLGQQPLQPGDVALVARGRRLSPRPSRAPTSGAPRRVEVVLRLVGSACACSMPLRAVETPLLVEVAVIGTLALAGERLGLGVGQLGARTIERDLYSAGSILHQHGPALHGLVVGTGTRSTVPPMRAATGVTCASTCASSVDSVPRVR